jgi:flagellar basal-body rod protein FlgF
VVNFKDPSLLAKRGNNYFQTDLASMPPAPALQTEVQQGKIEAANSQPAQSAVRLVNIMRQFETLQKAMAIGTEMNRSAVQEVAKVTS